jgi:phosphatidylinositol kinase/protein kinase (PI-3  family)
MRFTAAESPFLMSDQTHSFSSVFHFWIQFVFSKLQESYEMLWEFKRHFGMQIAVSGILCYLLSIENRIPPLILLSVDTAQLYHTNFVPRMHTTLFKLNHNFFVCSLKFLGFV